MACASSFFPSLRLVHCTSTKKYLFLFRQSLIPEELRMASKSSLKDKLEDDELDLSMMQLSEVPVRV